MNLREPRSEGKKKDQSLRNTSDKRKKNRMENSIFSPSCGEQGNKPRDYIQQVRYCLESTENLQKGEQWRGEMGL